MHALLASGRLNVEPAITYQMPYTDFNRGMELMLDGQCGKVVFEF